MNLHDLMDTFLWNEHTWLMHAIEPRIEELFPGVWRWFELKDKKDALNLIGKGVSVYARDGHYWLGIPREAPLEGYLQHCFLE